MLISYQLKAFICNREATSTKRHEVAIKIRQGLIRPCHQLFICTLLRNMYDDVSARILPTYIIVKCHRRDDETWNEQEVSSKMAHQKKLTRSKAILYYCHPLINFTQSINLNTIYHTVLNKRSLRVERHSGEPRRPRGTLYRFVSHFFSL